MNPLELAFSKLNDAQLEAVETIYGPVMVIAGPGTGKTQILALRAARLLQMPGIDPSNLLLTTFTEAWVIAMRKRLYQMIGATAYKVTITTIHGFCNDIIQAYPEHFLAYRASRPIDDITQIELIEKLLSKGAYPSLVSEYDRSYYVPHIRDRISKLKQEWVSPNDFDTIISKEEKRLELELDDIKPTTKKYSDQVKQNTRYIEKMRHLCLLYRDYTKQCQEDGYYDFSDMISYVGDHLVKDRDFALTLGEKYQFIMVDEYQDTNNAQNRIIDAILDGAESKNCFVVGDDDQSIYRFQGANLANMFHFSRKYADTRVIVLRENYRSTQPIIDLATQSINFNEWRIARLLPGITKEFHAARPQTGSIKALAYAHEHEEKAATLIQIQAILKDGCPPEEIAVIVRTNKEVEAWTRFLEANNLKVESRLKSNIFASSYVSLLLDLLLVMHDPSQKELELISVLRSGLLPIRRADILEISRKLYSANYKRAVRMTFFDALREEGFIKNTELIDKKAIVDFRDLIQELSLAPQEPFVRYVRMLLDRIGFLAFVEKEWSLSDLEDIFTLFRLFENWNENNRDLTLDMVLTKISYYQKYSLTLPRQILAATTGWVQVCTAHQSKGLEYEHVFIPSLSLGNWGDRRVIDPLRLPYAVAWGDEGIEISKSENQEEEKRLFYVALTRAKRYLTLSFPMIAGDRQKMQSVFLAELDLNPATTDSSIDYRQFIHTSLAPNIRVGTRLDPDEELYLKEFITHYRLSPSDLNKFLEDPRLFLRDVVFRFPFLDNEFTIFGKVYHRALELFHLEYRDTHEIPSEEHLVKSFLSLLSRENLTHEEEKRLREKGEKGLRGWYQQAVPTIRLPLHLEFNFYHRNIFLDDTIPLTGKIDKIEALDTDGKRVRLVDYKTGRPKSLKEIKGETAGSDGKYFRQLLFYVVMAWLDREFSFNYTIDSLGIEFVEGKEWIYKSVDVIATPEDVERVKEEIRTTWSKITNLEFWRDIMKGESKEQWNK